MLIYKISGWKECGFKANMRYTRRRVIYRASTGNQGRGKLERIWGGRKGNSLTMKSINF